MSPQTYRPQQFKDDRDDWRALIFADFKSMTVHRDPPLPSDKRLTYG